MIEVLRENIKSLRNEAGISQETLSRECHYDKTYVGKIERGDTTPSMEAILRIADVLGVKPTDLFQAELSDSAENFSDQMEDPSQKIGELFVDFFQNSPSILFLMSSDGEILQINKTANRILKADANQVTGRAIDDLPFWSQVGLSPDEVRDLTDLGAIGKNATRQVRMTYKGHEATLQIQVSGASIDQESAQFVVFQLFFLENTLNRTVMGDHFDLLKQSS